MAVRLDPFGRLIGVGWPSAPLLSAFRLALTVYHDAVGQRDYRANIQFHGDQTAIVNPLNRLEITFDGILITWSGGTESYSPLTTYAGGGSHPDIPTPAGYTSRSFGAVISSLVGDGPPETFDYLEFFFGGASLAAANVSGWGLYTRTVGPYPGPSSFRTYFRIA
jgi:hypothetical protein